MFENDHSTFSWSNDGRLQIVKQDNPKGTFCVVDNDDNHVELFTKSRDIAEAFVAGYDYCERLSRQEA